MTKRRLDAQKILSKLETVLKTQDRQVIADSLEMKKKTLDKALSRGTISLLILENFCSKNHVSMDFFIRDDEAMQASGMVRVPVDRMNVNVLLFNDWKERPDVRLEDYYAAPLVEDRIAAGYGRLRSGVRSPSSPPAMRAGQKEIQKLVDH